MGLFGWSLPPGCHELPDEAPEPSDRDLLRQANGRRLLRSYGCANWGELSQRVHRDSDCGISLGVLFHSHDDVVRVPMRLMGYGQDAWPVCLYLDAIVEGVDATTNTVIVDLDEPWKAGAALRAAIDCVEAQAEEIWQSTHGCWNCARLKGVAYEPGETPVVKGCGHCFGDGCIL